MANTSLWRSVSYRFTIERWGIAMYDLTYGQVFSGTPSCKGISARQPTTEATQCSRSKMIIALVGLTLVATTAAGAVTVRHKAPAIGFTSHFSSSFTTVGGSAGLEVALY